MLRNLIEVLRELVLHPLVVWLVPDPTERPRARPESPRKPLDAIPRPRHPDNPAS